MEESKFDDEIRKKLGEYSAPGFDPNALAALHQEMARKLPSSWYQKYKLETIASLMTVIISLVIIGSQWHLNTKSNTLLEKENASLKEQISTLSQLKDELERLRRQKPDTIHISQTDRNFLKPGFTTTAGKLRFSNSRGSILPASDYLNLRSLQELPVEILKTSVQDGYYAREENGNILFSPTQGNRSTLPQVAPVSPDPEQDPHKVNLLFKDNKDETKPVTEKKTTLQGKLTREQERHYQKGIGIKAGPTGELVRLNNRIGEKTNFIAVGLLADFFLSPRWSMETGVKYSERGVTVQGTQQLSHVTLPHADEGIGALQELEVDSKTFEIPLYLKYHYPASSRFDVILGVGASGLVLINQEFEYSYLVPGSNANQELSVIADHEITKWAFYPATVNFSAGINQQLDNNKALEVSLFYQKGARNIGKERMKADLFGVRAAYWFKMR
ncbi:outer membrane beta-barrel protein [Pontibacter pamirensis]|uniref:outer membrane beta-barrel protein n=1 Tax=Pontibacter pamirensis TaxID=2562824 RepID=UPI001389A6B9|nr:outer membrane beta-barrel protein [Pontibacter pamirensis]